MFSISIFSFVILQFLIFTPVNYTETVNYLRLIETWRVLPEMWSRGILAMIHWSFGEYLLNILSSKIKIIVTFNSPKRWGL